MSARIGFVLFNPRQHPIKLSRGYLSTTECTNAGIVDLEGRATVGTIQVGLRRSRLGIPAANKRPVFAPGSEIGFGTTNDIAALINRVIDGRPSDLTMAIHLCRGNYRSTWFAEGGYEPVAEILFNLINVNAYFLEYDDERSGDFSPLRFVPKDKVVILGIISSKVPALEKINDLTQRIKEAARYVQLENMGVSPQCGFSSTHHGNELTHDDQWRKLELVVNTARTVWGES